MSQPPNRVADRANRADTAALTLADWLRIDADGRVTVYTGKVEVGQGSRTELTKLVAEALAVPASAVTLVMADTAQTPFEMGTFGSRTTPTMGVHLRRVAALARDQLLDRAAARLGVPRTALEASDGVVRHAASGRALTYGELAGAQPLDAPAPPEPSGPAESGDQSRRPAGHVHSLPKVAGRAIVTGAHRYAADLRRPGMLIGKVLRPPRFGATLASLDTREAEAVPGAVVAREGDFVGVAAPDEAAAVRARAALQAEWTLPAQPATDDLPAYLREHLAEPPRGTPIVHEAGSVGQARRQAAASCTASYTAAYIAHAPLEPRAALAEWQDGALTVWTGSQRPFGVRKQLAEVFALADEQVRVIVPDTGAAYGGKHSGEAAVEAARLARAAGLPVRLVWTREEEFTWAYFRPAAVIDLTSAVRADGALLAWECHTYNAGGNAIRPPYNVPNQRIAAHPSQSPLRQGSYRALAATANIFARETHMDELAAMLRQDPLAFRLSNLADERLRAVLEAAAERFGWQDWQRRPHRGVGLACGTEKGSYVACCAEVAVDPDTRRVTIVRVVEAFECGEIINPANLRNQIEGAVVQGLGGALSEQIEFADGMIRNPRFSRYRVPRFADAPPIDVVLVDRPDLPPAGAGETPITTIAPALGNAVFAASGVRLRGLPLLPEGALPSEGEV